MTSKALVPVEAMEVQVAEHPLRRAVDQWLESLDVKPPSMRAYRLHIERYAEWLQANGRTGTLPLDLRDYRDDLLERHHAGELSIYTAREYSTTVLRFYGWLHRKGLSSVDLGADIKPIRARSEEHARDYLTAKQARSLVDSIGADLVGLRDRALVELKLRTGLRDISLIRADVGDLSVRDSGVGVLRHQGKGRDSKGEVVIVPPAALQALQAYLHHRKAWTDPRAPMFVSHSHRTSGQRLTSRGLREVLRSRLERAGLHSARVSAHSLRHTAATLALTAGVPLERVQEMLGHASEATTRIYARRLNREAGCAELAITF